MSFFARKSPDPPESPPNREGDTTMADPDPDEGTEEIPPPTKKDFEALVYKQLTSPHTEIREAFKAMVSLITDGDSSEAALSALKDYIKREAPLTQLKALSILSALVKNCGHEFHVELATKKWMDRLLKLVRMSRDERVKEKVLQLLVDWGNQFQLQPQLQEFSIAVHRLKAKGVELPPPTDKTAGRHRRQRSSSRAGVKNRATPGDSQLSALEIVMTNIQADISNLELGLQRPEMLQEGIAEECRRHLQKIQVILSTDLPDSATYEFLDMSDQLHELLGLYDALFTDSSPGQIEAEREMNEIRRLEHDLARENEAIAQKQAEIEELHSQLKEAEEELRIANEAAKKAAMAEPKTELERRMQAKLTDVMSLASNLRQNAVDIKAMMNEDKKQILEIRSNFNRDLSKTLNEFPEFVEKIKLGETKAYLTLKKLYTIEVSTRKKLYNKLQELRGNIRVYCRVRPISEKEKTYGGSVCQYPAEGEITIKEGNKLRNYEFDLVFTEKATQEQVFEDTKPLVNCVVDGYKVCIFAYGQTGSGKTHTMMGPSHDPGVNMRAIQRLFDLVEEHADVERIRVSLSVLEIYNENIRDLLNSSADADKLKYEIKTHPVEGQYVENLISHDVSSIADIEKWIKAAERNRSYGKTNMNEHSSRSHMLLYLVVRTTNLNSNVTTVGKLSLVDLAGSERLVKSGATGDRLKETQSINKSLSALGDVIASLSRNDSHTPYRNSKLTHLLKDSLGGNSKCLMFVNCSPSVYNANESNNSLQFAFRARGVVLGPAKKNIQANQPQGDD